MDPFILSIGDQWLQPRQQLCMFSIRALDISEESRRYTENEQFKAGLYIHVYDNLAQEGMVDEESENKHRCSRRYKKTYFMRIPHSMCGGDLS